MIKYILHLLTFLLLLIPPLSISASPVSDFEVRQLNTQGQLPVSAIHSVYRDREGYLWYGTVNGLCRDDGYHLQIFRPSFLQAQDKVIFCMLEDENQHLWLGADNGLYRFDKRNNATIQVDSVHWEGERILKILAVNPNRFWIAGSHQIAIVDSLGVLQKEYSMIQSGTTMNIRGMALYQGNPYVSFKGGSIACLDPKTSQWKELPNPESDSDISWIETDRLGDGLWLLFEKGSLWHYRFDENGSECMERYNLDPAVAPDAYYLQQNPSDQSLWIISSKGTDVYQPAGGLNMKRVFCTQNDVPNNHMFAQVLCDSLFSLVSAFDCPSLLIRAKKNAFSYTPLQSITDRLGFHATVMALADAGDGWWWIFQERTGISLYNIKTQQSVLWSDGGQVSPYVLNSGRIICNSSKGVWINKDTNSQVFHLVRNGASMQVVAMLDLKDQFQPTEIVTELCEDNKGRLWIGTNLQLLVYDASKLTLLARYPDMGYVSDIKLAERGHLYMATLQGNLYDFTDEKTKECFDSRLSISALCQMPNGALWLGTQTGEVWRYEGKDKDFRNYTEACGLNGDRINQLVADSYGHLWVETNQRILEYNPRNNASHIYATFDEEVPMTRFLPTAVMTDSLGQIYFGGIPGVIQFHPSNSLDRQADIVKVHITDVEVMKHSLLFPTRFEGQSTSEITLQPEDRDLEIFFSSLDYFDIQHVRYAYRLKGVDKDWKYTVSGQNSAFYNQLPKGTYEFEVKATDQNGLWCEYVAHLTVHRLPAFYESTAAYIIYIILVVLALSLLILLVQRRDRKQNDVMWSDSQEMLQMRNYIKGVEPTTVKDMQQPTLPENEYRQLDKLFVERATEAVMQHIHESDFGVEELASAVNVSKTTLNRKLKAITKQSPLDFIRTQKMRQACLWLQDRDRNITEIAIDLGYADRKYFTSCFKKEFGQTPTEYRNEKLGMKSQEGD